jgi:hypothetical protein
MTDTDVTFLPKHHNMDPARFYVMILTPPPSLPLSRRWAGLAVGCVVAFTITPRDSRVASPRVITFQLCQCPWIQKFDY